LAATSLASYGYDANGNTLSKNDSTGITAYTWDFENRLTSVILPGSGGTVSFNMIPSVEESISPQVPAQASSPTMMMATS